MEYFQCVLKSKHLNGYLENTCQVSSVLSGNPTNITIGYIPILNTNNGMTYFQVKWNDFSLNFKWIEKSFLGFNQRNECIKSS